MCQQLYAQTIRSQDYRTGLIDGLKLSGIELAITIEGKAYCYDAHMVTVDHESIPLITIQQPQVLNRAYFLTPYGINVAVRNLKVFLGTLPDKRYPEALSFYSFYRNTIHQGVRHFVLKTALMSAARLRMKEIQSGGTPDLSLIVGGLTVPASIVAEKFLQQSSTGKKMDLYVNISAPNVIEEDPIIQHSREEILEMTIDEFIRRCVRRDNLDQGGKQILTRWSSWSHMKRIAYLGQFVQLQDASITSSSDFIFGAGSLAFINERILKPFGLSTGMELPGWSPPEKKTETEIL